MKTSNCFTIKINNGDFLGLRNDCLDKQKNIMLPLIGGGLFFEIKTERNACCENISAASELRAFMEIKNEGT